MSCEVGSIRWLRKEIIMFIDTREVDEFQAILGGICEYVDSKTPDPYILEEVDSMSGKVIPLGKESCDMAKQKPKGAKKPKAMC